MYVNNFFVLRDTDFLYVDEPQWGYGAFSQFVFYTYYSRLVDGRKELWADVVVRVINGIMSIRKDWYVKNKIHWDETKWQKYAKDMATSMFRMEWLPSGRGLWAMGTPMIYTRGAMALYNCAYTDVSDNWIDDLCWLMDTLMYGAGVGFSACGWPVQLYEPVDVYMHQIPDSREGWVDSVKLLLEAYQHGWPKPIFDYSKIRLAGEPIRTFGGVASGPGPLQELHKRIEILCAMYMSRTINATMFKNDLANCIGVCIVLGNVRRGAEMSVGDINDPVFMDLKNYEKYPYRQEWGWMSNDSVRLVNDADFELLFEIPDRVKRTGNPGYINMQNVPKGRIGKNDDYIPLIGQGSNPCGEIVGLESRETCNVADTCPTRCIDVETWLNACKYASFYCSTVTLLPTHQPSTNAVLAKNRRIGVSIIDFVGWKHIIGTSGVTAAMRRGYQCIKENNKKLAAEAGIPASIRLTTIKPGGTAPKLPGRNPGISHPNYTYMIRRALVEKKSHVALLLAQAGVPFAESVRQKTAYVFEFPLYCGSVRSAGEVSLWEQAMNLVLVQREWADNAVSNTLYFDTNDDLEAVLAAIAPLTKSVALMPRCNLYEQMPEEGITREEYFQRLLAIKEIAWENLLCESIEGDKYCTAESCQQ